MADASSLSDNLEFTVVLLAAGVAAVPLFRRLGLGSVLGYFAAGLVVGAGNYSHSERIPTGRRSAKEFCPVNS